MRIDNSTWHTTHNDIWHTYIYIFIFIYLYLTSLSNIQIDIHFSVEVEKKIYLIIPPSGTVTGDSAVEIKFSIDIMIGCLPAWKCMKGGFALLTLIKDKVHVCSVVDADGSNADGLRLVAVTHIDMSGNKSFRLPN